MSIYICNTAGIDPAYSLRPARSSGFGSALAHSLLAHALSCEYGIAIPELAEDETGKPFFPSRPDVFFSLSHSRDHVMAAVSDSPVGADIEDSARSVSDVFVSRLMTAEERRLFRPLELWVLRESQFKLRGAGDLRSMRFDRRDGEPVSSEPGVFCRLYTLPGLFCAVCSGRDAFPPAPVSVSPAALLRESAARSPAAPERRPPV